MARVTRNQALEQAVTRRLSDRALEAERRFLAANRGFELPYGRAWLLLLLDELGRRASVPSVVGRMREETERSLLDWLRSTSYPEGKTKRGSLGFVATHNSWLFTYLLMILSRPRAGSTREQLRALRADKLERRRGALDRVQHTDWDFLYLPAVQAVIDRVEPPVQGSPARYPVVAQPAVTNPPFTSATAHRAGAALVRIWPYGIDARAGDEQACARFHSRLAEIFSRPDQWADSFEHVSHWVPQFIWMALWLEAGRP
jgi:hypothetical protein